MSFMRAGDRLYTIYNVVKWPSEKWVVKVEKVMPNRLFEETYHEFWTLDGVYHFVKVLKEDIS